MCGIVGFQREIEEGTEREKSIRQMMAAIKHRGPDDEGIFLAKNTTLGHVRLAIIDIAHGQQPMTILEGRYTIAFNGEIYNYIELRQYLVKKGYKLLTHSDTEVLLYLYVEYGKKMVDYLNGMFAFCIYDKKEELLFLARDHFGIKPLYYLEGKEEFIFGSEIKSILKYPGVQAIPNQTAIHEYLSFQFIPGRNTLFKNIYKLEPAEYLFVKKGKISERKHYWNLNYDKINSSKSEDHYAEELLVLLNNSASIQTRSDVEVGAYLSGGLDSSIIATLASKNYPGSLKTFSGGFKESNEYDETRYAKIVSKNINSTHYTIFPTHHDFLNHFERLVYMMDEPAAGPGIFPQYMVAQLASKHVKVVLGGQGGDEIFGGYSRYFVAYLEQCLKGAIYESQEEGQHVVTLQSIIGNLPQMKQYTNMIRTQFASGLFDSMDKRYFRLIDRSVTSNIIYQTEFLSQKNNEKIFDTFSQIFNSSGSSSYFNKMTYFDIKTLLPALLQVEDRVSMAMSIESRVPFLDKRIVELACNMSPVMKFANGKGKHMLRKAVQNILPKEIMNRKDKMGFPTPFNEWIKGPLKEYTLDIFNSVKSRQRNIFNFSGIENELANESQFGRNLWGALNLEIWFQHYIDK